MKSLTSWPTTSNFGGIEGQEGSDSHLRAETLSFDGLGRPGGGIYFVEERTTFHFLSVAGPAVGQLRQTEYTKSHYVGAFTLVARVVVKG
jgi:hypothetical protein